MYNILRVRKISDDLGQILLGDVLGPRRRLERGHMAEKFESWKVRGEKSPRSMRAIFLQLTNIYGHAEGSRPVLGIHKNQWNKPFALEGLTDLAGEAPGIEPGWRGDLQGVRFYLDTGKNVPTNKGHLKWAWLPPVQAAVNASCQAMTWETPTQT